MYSRFKTLCSAVSSSSAWGFVELECEVGGKERRGEDATTVRLVLLLSLFG